MLASHRTIQQSVEQVYGEGGLREVSFMQLLNTFWSTKEALGEDFKYTWVRVKPDSSMHFMSDMKNEEMERVTVTLE